MSTTTLSGPIKAGTIQSTTGTTYGEDVANVGYGVCVQTDTLTQADTSAKSLGIYLPENSQVLAIEVLVEDPFLENDTFDCGVVGGSANLLVDGYGAGTVDMGGRYYKPLYGQTTAPAAASQGNWIVGNSPLMNISNWYNVTTTSGIIGDVQLSATYIAAGSAASSARLRLNVMYIPGRNASAPTAWGA